MQSLEKNPDLQLLHMTGHVLNVLNRFPGGLPDGSTIPEAVELLRPVAQGSADLVDLLDAATTVQEAVTVFARAPRSESQQAFKNAVQAFLAFRGKEKPACLDNVH